VEIGLRIVLWAVTVLRAVVLRPVVLLREGVRILDREGDAV